VTDDIHIIGFKVLFHLRVCRHMYYFTQCINTL